MRSLDTITTSQGTGKSYLRMFTAAVLNGVPVPETVRAVLEANGVNTYELEHRMLHQLGMKAA